MGSYASISAALHKSGFYGWLAVKRRPSFIWKHSLLGIVQKIFINAPIKSKLDAEENAEKNLAVQVWSNA